MAFVEQDIASIGGGGRGGYAYPVAVGGGNGGYGNGDSGFGIWGILIVVVVLWLLFRDGDHGKGGYGDGIENSFNRFGGLGGFGGNNCAYDCKPKMVVDMSNCEVDKDLWKVDADLQKCCCEEKELIISENSKTRELIQANLLAELKEKLCEKNTEVQALKTQQYTDAKFDALNSKLCKIDNEDDMQYYKLNTKIDSIFCEIPKRPPVWCEGITPNTHHTDCHDFPRRAFKNDCCDCGC